MVEAGAAISARSTPALLNTSDRISPIVDSRSAVVRLTPLIYSATLFVSALLLFSIEPMFAKMVLRIYRNDRSTAVDDAHASWLDVNALVHCSVLFLPASLIHEEPPQLFMRSHP